MLEVGMLWHKRVRFSGNLMGVEMVSFGEEGVNAAEAKRREDVARKEGYEEAKKIYEEEIRKVKEEKKGIEEGVLRRIGEGYEEVVGEINKRLPDLLVFMVGKVCSGMKLDREGVMGVVDEVLNGSAPKGEALEVYLSDGDYGVLMGEEKVEVERKYGNVEFKRDGGLRSGDCIVKSRFGLIDATLETKLKQIRQELG